MAKRDLSPIHGAYFEGGKKALDEHVRIHLQYPEQALQKGVQGTIHLFLDINHKGEVKHVKVISGIGHGCDEEAVRVVKMMKFKAEKVRGMHVVYHHKLQIHFRINKNQQATKEIVVPEVETSDFEVAYHYVIVPNPPKKKTTAPANKNTKKVLDKESKPKVIYTYTL